MYATPPPWAPEFGSVVWTVEHVTYDLHGPMPASYRRDVAAGWAHLVMASDDGRRAGAMANHVVPAPPARHWWEES
jgi:hypothetical protein